jgi:NADPH:quinone reductase-like Zn-dependent oxidoreductase
MKAWHQRMGGGLDSLSLREHAVPQAGPGEVRVRMRAVSLNARELSILLHGRYPLPVKPDGIAAADGAGEVDAVGPGVARWKVGDRVLASIFPHWQDGPFGAAVAAQLGGSLDGTLAEQVVLPEAAWLPVPAHLSYEEAATLPCAGVTAWNALGGGAVPLRAGDEVLTLGSGGVSLFALQLARASGARVIATTSGDEKAERLRSLGADAVVNYREVPEWGAEVRRLTHGTGVRHVVEVGGGGTLPQSLKAVGFSGEVAFVGTTAGGSPMFDANALFASGATLRVVAAGSTAQLAQALRVVALHEIRPVIDRVFDFDEAPRAFAHYARQQSFGKVVLRVNP